MSNIEGDVIVFHANGKKYVCRPTLAAADAISRAFGGYQPAFEKVQALDFASICAVLLAGQRLKGQQSEDARENFFREGVSSLAVSAMEFLNLLAHGGKKPVAATDDDEDEAPASDADEGNA